MYKINIKPMSVNGAFKGRKFRTKEYDRYEKSIMLMLPKIKLPPQPFALTLEFGFSSPLADVSNPIKLIEDILQKKYDFNDREIYKVIATKKHVKKGQEYILWNIETYKD